MGAACISIEISGNCPIETIGFIVAKKPFLAFFLNQINGVFIFSNIETIKNFLFFIRIEKIP